MLGYSQLRVYTVIALAGAITFIAACATRSDESRAQGKRGAETAQPTPVQIVRAAAAARTVPSYIQATGSLAAQETSDLAPETSGQVIATPVDVGASVSQGSVIARLDDRDARLRVQQAQAAEQQAVAALRQAQARLGLGPNGRFDANQIPEVRAAYQQYQSAEAAARLAEANARRYENLVETGDVSRSIYDQQRTQAETARAQSNAARQQYEVALNQARQGNQGVAAQQAALEGARAQLGLAQKALRDTVIRTPLAGFVSDRPAAVGEYVTTSSKVATVVKINPLKLRLQLPETQAGKIGVGMQVEGTVAAYADQPFSGRVTAINPAVDPTSRIVLAEVEVANPDRKLRPGMFVTARIIQPGGERAVFVPRSAVQLDESTNSARVYVIENANLARLRVVQIAEAENNEYRILAGLSGGETVAASNLEQLYDGAVVSSKQ